MGQSEKGRDYVNARPPAVPHMLICSGKETRGRVREVKHLKERQIWRSGREKCEQKCHRMV